MFPLVSPNDVLLSCGDMLGPFGFQPLHGFAQKGWMSYKLLLSLGGGCGVTSCLTPDEPAVTPVQCLLQWEPLWLSGPFSTQPCVRSSMDTPKPLFLSLSSASAVISLVC